MSNRSVRAWLCHVYILGTRKGCMPDRIRAGLLTSVWVQFSPWLFNVTRPTHPRQRQLLHYPNLHATIHPAAHYITITGRSLLHRFLSRGHSHNHKRAGEHTHTGTETHN